MEGNKRTRLGEVDYQESEVQENLTIANQATTKPPAGFSLSNNLNAFHNEESNLIPCEFCPYKSPSFDALLFNTLRFILPCKSDCQPIFLKKQGIY